MILTVNETSFAIAGYSKTRDNRVGVYATFKIPEDSIDLNSLAALFKNNAFDILITEDDGSVTTLCGYHTFGNLSNKGGFHYLEQICDSETAHLLNEVRKQIELLKQDAANQAGALSTLGQAVTAQGEALASQGETLTEQTKQVEALTDDAAMQSDTIDSLLLEVIPTIIETAVKDAVTKALESSTAAASAVEE